MTDHDDVRRMASDPGTDWETLHWIAEDYPELRADVAANPTTYPELIEALADLDDPEINAALMRRFSPQEHQPVAEPPAETQPESAATTLLDQDSSVEGRGHMVATGATGAGAVGARRRGERRRRVGVVVFAVLLPLIAVGAIAALAVTLLSDRGTPAAEQPAPAGDETTAPDEAEDEPEEAEPEEDTGPTIEDAREALAELPGGSACEVPGDDAETFTLVAELSEEGSWPAEDQELVRGTLEELRDECGDAHAARVFQLLSGENAEDEALSASVSAMGTDWFDFAFPAGGAFELTSFVAPSGNVVCEIGEDLHCQVLSHSFEAPEGCEEGSTFRIRVSESPQPDCENPVAPAEQAQVLQYGETASNGFFACTSFRSQMSCWNQLTGEGFNLSSTRNSFY